MDWLFMSMLALMALTAFLTIGFLLIVCVAAMAWALEPPDGRL